MYLAFHDSARIFSCPRWLARTLIWLALLTGVRWILKIAPYLPANYKRWGLCCFDPHFTWISDDGRHCLFMQPTYCSFQLWRATTDLQREHWHGIAYPKAAVYRSPHLINE